MDEGLFRSGFFVTAAGSATRVSGATAFAVIAIPEDGEDGEDGAFVSGALVRVAVASAGFDAPSAAEGVGGGFCSGTAAWNASRHPMTYATLRTPLTVPRRFGGDTSERYRGTICDDAPTPTPVTSRPIVMAPNESALALINVPIVNGTVVANSAALRPARPRAGRCRGRPGSRRRRARRPPRPSRRRPRRSRGRRRSREGRVDHRAVWYPNRNAPRQAVATLGTRPGPTSSQSNGFCGAFAFPSAVEDEDDDPLDVVMGPRSRKHPTREAPTRLPPAHPRSPSFPSTCPSRLVPTGSRAPSRARGGGLAGLRTTAGLTSAGVATGLRPALTTRACEKPRLELDVAASATAGRVIAATARETRRQGSSRPARRLCPWTARERESEARSGEGISDVVSRDRTRGVRGLDENTDRFNIIFQASCLTRVASRESRVARSVSHHPTRRRSSLVYAAPPCFAETPPGTRRNPSPFPPPPRVVSFGAPPDEPTKEKAFSFDAYALGAAARLGRRLP